MPAAAAVAKSLQSCPTLCSWMCEVGRQEPCKIEAFTLCLEAIRDKASYHPEHTIYSQAMCVCKEKSQLETCLDITAQQEYDLGKNRWERTS